MGRLKRSPRLSSARHFPSQAIHVASSSTLAVFADRSCLIYLMIEIFLLEAEFCASAFLIPRPRLGPCLAFARKHLGLSFSILPKCTSQAHARTLNRSTWKPKGVQLTPWCSRSAHTFSLPPADIRMTATAYFICLFAAPAGGLSSLPAS